MPRYFFNVRNHVNTRDDVGVDLIDLKAAKGEALQDIADIMEAKSEAVGDKWPLWSIEICDRDRNVLLVVPFSSN